ncbi:hypothetical protein C8U37_105111 [Trichococcus patagoniensis]|uniref:Uncharacterized protein n=1 Tax=Trichococcus patagoniensis TaxID=382641 RepID=A0A2T5IN43_9LACT|nr:hypothetical protein C8U37_105111 [Trichococcus patagoniensis]
MSGNPDEGRFTGAEGIKTEASPAKPNPPQPAVKSVRALLGATASMRYNLSRKLGKDWRRLN